jgi:hypothetical protein
MSRETQDNALVEDLDVADEMSLDTWETEQRYHSLFARPQRLQELAHCIVEIVNSAIQLEDPRGGRPREPRPNWSVAPPPCVGGMQAEQLSAIIEVQRIAGEDKAHADTGPRIAFG